MSQHANKDLDIHAVIPIGDLTQAPPNSTPVNILYIKVIYALQSDGTLSEQYAYDPISGFYPLGNGISSFVNLIRAGGPYIDDQLSPATADADIVVEDPCYIVFSVDFGKPAQFVTPATGAVTTADSLSDEYFNVRIAKDSASHPTSYHIAYLRAVSPSTNGLNNLPDNFNLNFNVVQSDGSLVPSTLDPEIKNKGHGSGGNGNALVSRHKTAKGKLSVA